MISDGINMISSIFRLTRFYHAIMIALAVLLGVLFSGSFPPLYILLIGILAPVFSEMAAFSLNDYLDIKTDKINKKNRPLVTGELSPSFAYNFSIFCFFISTLLSFFLGWIPFFIILFFNVFSAAYNYKLKDLPLIGNIYIGFSMAIPFIYGNILSSFSISEINFLLFIIALNIGTAREIIKSIEDMEGDKKARDSNTLPILIGKKNSSIVVLFFVLISMISLIFLFQCLKFSVISFPLFLFSFALLVVSCAKLFFLKTKKDYSYIRIITLVSLVLGLLSLTFAYFSF
ncbi:UbiA family prenyltransferase [Candidatus Micrarchaeota archaeon]|nr:UbiA family prenyltransferase [Candidatus Micrarchaeota archaeon]